jgi:hypothetical protein
MDPNEQPTLGEQNVEIVMGDDSYRVAN